MIVPTLDKVVFLVHYTVTDGTWDDEVPYLITNNLVDAEAERDRNNKNVGEQLYDVYRAVVQPSAWVKIERHGLEVGSAVILTRDGKHRAAGVVNWTTTADSGDPDEVAFCVTWHTHANSTDHTHYPRRIVTWSEEDKAWLIPSGDYWPGHGGVV